MDDQQIHKASHIASLLVGDMRDTLSPGERTELNQWLQEWGDNYLLYEELMDEDKLTTDLNELNKYNSTQAFEKLRPLLSAAPAMEMEVPGKRLYFRITTYMVAAVVLLVAGGIAYFALNNNKIADKPKPSLAITAQKKAPGDNPDTKKAVLILADGSTIALNEMNNGAIAHQGNVTVQKNNNGELVYSVSGNNDNPTGVNTLRTPRGGEYQVVLEDGTRIWLNSASSLQFPVHFSSAERRVSLTGEAYFEVQSVVDASTGNKKSFSVMVDNMEVKAVGTSFNIAAYKEDKRSQTTVVEGMVQVNRNNKSNLLKPGKKLIASETATTIEDADIKQETAWKSGDFVFKNTSLEMVMNELARWYDMNVVYDKNVPTLHFSGEVQRSSSINSVLQMLEYTGGVTFTISKRTISVHGGKK